MNLEEAKASIGKAVVLNEDTKPYRLSSGFYKSMSSVARISDGSKIVIRSVAHDGDTLISTYDEDNNVTSQQYIDPIHLSLAIPTLQEMDELEKPKGTVLDSLSVDVSLIGIDSLELRLAIFNGKPSRTLKEMQEIESWILGAK